MTIQYFHNNTIRQRKNREWLQGSRNSVKPENDTKIKILKISKNYHKPSLPQRLERFSKVTPCNEKCNVFNLLKGIPLLRILLIGIIHLHRNGISPLVQFLNLLFCRRGMPGECLNGIHTVDLWHSYPPNARGMSKWHSYRWFHAFDVDLGERLMAFIPLISWFLDSWIPIPDLIFCCGVCIHKNIMI